MKLLAALALLAAPALPGADAPAGLTVVFVDCEGGAAALIRTPAGESVLVDPGYPGDRDAGRIAEAAKALGISRIDHFISTHWHIDHVGGLPDVAKRIPVAKFYDRGLPPSPRDEGTKMEYVDAYRRLSGGKSTVLGPGDEVPLAQAPGSPPLSLRCVVSRCRTEGTIESAKTTAGCTAHEGHNADTSDNAKSLGFVLRLGDFRFALLGDITWNVEHALACPVNRIGRVDVYQVTHHGFDISNNPVLLEAIRPRVAIMPNGPEKGGAPSVVAALKGLGTEIYQLHRNVKSRESENAPRENIANWDEKCGGEPIVLRVSPDGKNYSVKVGRSGVEKKFETTGKPAKNGG
jgi:beta-lactamase superfamily II metal-dependent hydrolase